MTHTPRHDQFGVVICSCGLVCLGLAEWQRHATAVGVFSEAEYSDDPGRVIAHAVSTGRAVVARADGSARVVISIPAAEQAEQCECWATDGTHAGFCTARPGQPAARGGGE